MRPPIGSDSATCARPSTPLSEIQTAAIEYLREGSELSVTVGRYRLVSRLGSGGFGVVYQGWDDQLRREVAIKVLVRDESTGYAEKLLAEARLLAQLDHPSIVPVYDIGRNPAGQVFIVSKLVDGHDLAHELSRGRPDHRRAVQLTARIAEALDYAHHRGIIHRDVKPANILLSADGAPVLADFGLAMRDSEFGTGSRFAGTPAYMSPEQARHEGHRVDGRSDIYSLGTVFYELLTGQRPFQAATVEELLDCVRNVEVRPLRQLDHQIPRELERICLRALAKRAADRYSTAGDLAEDLRHWEAISSHPVSPPPPGLAAEALTRSDATSSAHGAAVIVPRGLRPFEATDADFFLHLLPGPRDRDGIPESVRFWKTRIEETETDAAFRVGLLLGPSGCGKSSLLRAGVVPRLDERVSSLFVEARADELDQRLIERLHRRIPATQDARTLQECLTRVRQRRGLPAGHKLLLIIDQFEQWLSQHDLRSGAGLVEALRQCDGVTIQTLLLVRDDFTLAATRFMEALEEPLLQNRNFATVDLFGIEHARRVLTAFGRSFGMLTEAPNREQQKFLETAVQELAEDGHVVPVRLAVFAEMVKDKPWIPATLHQFGGMKGIGIAFLEDRLAGPNAHPYLKTHLPLVKSLLQKLLPDGEASIKGRAKTRQELDSAAIELLSGDPIDKILGLLDTETRLITPTGGESSGSTESTAAVRERTYQLAHDYLVPALRAWLSAEERSTRAGRARLRLRELAELWHRHPEPRRLPTWLEWSSIRLLTNRRAWATSEQTMMAAASRRIRHHASVLFIVAAAILTLGQEGISWWQARMLTERLLNADTREVPNILSQIAEHARWARPQLESLAAGLAPAVQVDSADDRQRRRRLHVDLALATEGARDWQAIIDQLPTVPVDHLPAIRSCWIQSDVSIRQQMWPAFQQSMVQPKSAALPLGAMLAGDSADPALWKPHLPELAHQLAAVRPSHIVHWCELYRPMAELLVPHLLDLYRNRLRPADIVRSNLVELLSRYTADDRDSLATAVELAEPREIPLLLEAARGDPLALRTELRRRLQTLTLRPRRPIAPGSGELPAEFQQQIAQAGGMIDAESCCLYALSPEQFASLSSLLTKFGFSPQSVRPFQQEDQQRIAVAFERVPQPWEIQWRLPEALTRQYGQERREAGWELADFALSENSSPTGNTPAWTLLWHHGRSAPVETKWYFDLPLAEHARNFKAWSEEGFALARWDVRIPAESGPLVTAIWRKWSDDFIECDGPWNYAVAAGDRYPGQLQTDLRSHRVALPEGDPLGLFEEYLKRVANYEQWEVTKADQGDAARGELENALFQGARFRSALGHFAAAEETLNQLLPRRRSSLRMHEHLAELYARTGKLEKLRHEIETLPELERRAKTEKPKPGVISYLKLRDAAATYDAERARQLLEELARSAEDSPQGKDFYVRALAVVAGCTQLGELAGASLQKLIRVLKQPAATETITERRLLFFEVDLRPVREHPVFQEYLIEAGYDRRFQSAFVTTPAFESRQLLSLAPSDHNREASKLRAAGFRPTTLDVQSARSPGQILCSSVWQREVMPIADQIRQAQRQANIALALALANEYDAVFTALQGVWGRDVRSKVVVEASRLLAPEPLIAKLINDPNLDSELQRVLLLTVGGFDGDRISHVARDNLELRIASWAASAEHAGLRSAAVWCARQWNVNLDAAAPALPATSVNARGKWWLNPVRQVMVEIRPSDQFLMGSPPWEEGRGNDESLHWASIRRVFAMAETEVTNAQFQEFLEDPRVRPYYASGLKRSAERFSPDPNCPRLFVQRLDAMRFCQWLSEREGISESQWCYPEIWKRGAEQSALPQDHLRRTGYRLPTEMEWEHAARAGARDAFYFGNDESLITSFEWLGRNSDGQSHPVAQLRPNDFGLFDMLGNAMEWTTAFGKRYEVPAHSSTRLESVSDLAERNGTPISRGGHFGSAPNSMRAAKRTTPSSVTNALGFRVARTVAVEN